MFAIQTQGGGNRDRWVNTFLLEYSQDCANFSRILDVSGNTKVRGFLICLPFHSRTCLSKQYRSMPFNGVCTLFIVTEITRLCGVRLRYMSFSKLIFLIQNIIRNELSRRSCLKQTQFWNY